MTKGAITRQTFSAAIEEIQVIPHFQFGNSIPTLRAIFEVSAPKYVKMGFLLKGADTTMIRRTVTEKNGMVIYRFTATNVPAEKEYSAVPSGLYYKPHVIPYVISFRLTGAKRDSVLSGALENSHKFKYAYVKGRNLENDEFINKKATELTRSAYSDREKVQRIYDWVQTSFHYKDLGENEENYFHGMIPRQADTVCKRMYGDCKDMSSVFNAMLAKAGIKSYYVTIGTNQKPYTHDELQTNSLYDHMIAAVKLDGEWVFLDGTTHIMPMGANRHDLQGKEAYIMLDERNYKVVKIPEVSAAQNVFTDNTTMDLSYDDLSGTVNQRYSGYQAWDIAEDLAEANRKEEKDELVRTLLLRGNSKFLVKNYNINAGTSGNKDVTLNASYSIGNYAQRVKNDYFVNMNVNRTMAGTRINDENRNIPVYKGYKRTIKETVTLNIPKGYRVSYLPKTAKGGVSDLWTYSISYRSDPQTRTVVLTKEYVLNTLKIKPEQFEAYNKLVDDVKKQYKETVVLTGR